MSFIVYTLKRLCSTWIGYCNQVPGKIFSYPMPSKEPSDTIRYMIAKYYARNRILILGLMAASDKSYGVPNIGVSGESMLKTKLIKYRVKDGMLKVCKLSYLELQQMITVLECLPSVFINKFDLNPIVL